MLPALSSVNYHFTRLCNFGCKFCFHTAKTKETPQLDDMTKVLTLLREAGVEKVNFAGGEPFRFKAELGKLLRHARSLGMYTSIITNGSLLTPEWMKANAGNLDMLGMSFDSASDAVNYDLGRWAKGGKRPDPAAPDRAVSKLRRAAELAHEHGVAFKMNTVVTALNADELLAPLINEVRPARWKVFQVLAVDTENSGEGALTNVRPLLVGREAFDAYVDRNRSQLDDPGILKAEPNDVMQASYIILDERARLLDPSTGGKIPTQSILDVGVHEAARQLFSSEGRGFNSRAFDERDGGFFHEQRSGGCGAREPAAKAPTAGASVETESEVEVKFQPPPHLASELERRGAEGVRKVFTDTYFDTAAATLTTRDHWLRLRSGVIELKRPNTDAAAARAESELRVDFYTEERAWPAISAALAKLGVELATQVPPDAYGVTAALERAGVAPFAVLTTARTRFAATLCGHDVHVDLDEVTFGGELPATRGGTEGGGAYAVGEVELVKAAPGTAPREALRQVLAELGVQAAAAAGAAPQVRGKVLEYIYRYDERRWRALGASGLLAEKLGA